MFYCPSVLQILVSDCYLHIFLIILYLNNQMPLKNILYVALLASGSHLYLVAGYQVVAVLADPYVKQCTLVLS